MKKEGIMIDIEGFKKFENKKELVQLKGRKDIEAFVIVTPEKKKMSLVVDFNNRILYPFFCGIRYDDGTALKD